MAISWTADTTLLFRRKECPVLMAVPLLPSAPDRVLFVVWVQSLLGFFVMKLQSQSTFTFLGIKEISQIIQ